MDILERYRAICPDYDAFRAVLREPLPTCIVANTLRTTRDDLQQRLLRRNVQTRTLAWSDDALVLARRNAPGHRFEYMTGLYNVQEEAAVIPVKILDPQPGERILDLCAAPGNKSAQIAIAMQNRGTVVANDRSGGRHRASRSILDRLGLANVSLSLHNGINFPRAAGTFQRVLVDAPCSCEGTSRKQANVLDAKPDYASLARVQRLLLKRAFEVCEPGGRVVYSTCTYAPEENEAVVDAVLRDLNFGVTWVPCRLPGFVHTPGLTSWNGQQFDPRMELTMRVWPHTNDTGGFFVAAFDKSPDAPMQREVPEPPELFRPIDATAWTDSLRDRFGLDDFGGWSFFQPNTKAIAVTNDHLAPPAGVKYNGAGVVFMRTAMAVPKLTTAAAMMFGGAATRGIVDVDPATLDAFFRREDIEVERPNGSIDHVLLRCEGVVAGVGRYRANTATVESTYPRAWALPPTVGQDHASAFEAEP